MKNGEDVPSLDINKGHVHFVELTEMESTGSGIAANSYDV